MHVFNSGPTRAQPIKGVQQHLTIGGRYLPFVQVLSVHVRYKSHSSPRQSRCWHKLKILSFSQCSLSFAHSCSTCTVQIQPRQHSHVPWLLECTPFKFVCFLASFAFGFVYFIRWGKKVYDFGGEEGWSFGFSLYIINIILLFLIYNNN